MSITLTFHNFSEKKPAHNEQIIFLRKLYSFDSYGFDPRESTVEYQWSLVDSDGDDCGDYVCYDEDDPTPPELTEEDKLLLEKLMNEPDNETNSGIYKL